MVKNSILLFGGGKETLYNLFSAKEKIGLMLYVDFNREASMKEIEALTYYSELLWIPFRVIKIPPSIMYLPPTFSSGAKGESDHVFYRNSFLLSVAGNMALTKGFTNIITGVTRKGQVYNDGVVDFLRDWKKLSLKQGYKLNFESPSASKYTSQIINALIRNKWDISKLWSCNGSQETHCGTCAKCVTIIEEYHNGAYPSREAKTYFKKFYSI